MSSKNNEEIATTQFGFTLKLLETIIRKIFRPWQGLRVYDNYDTH